MKTKRTLGIDTCRLPLRILSAGGGRGGGSRAACYMPPLEPPRGSILLFPVFFIKVIADIQIQFAIMTK